MIFFKKRDISANTGKDDSITIYNLVSNPNYNRQIHLNLYDRFYCLVLILLSVMYNAQEYIFLLISMRFHLHILLECTFVNCNTHVAIDGVLLGILNFFFR